jgi:hypothetical protein
MHPKQQDWNPISEKTDKSKWIQNMMKEIQFLQAKTDANTNQESKISASKQMQPKLWK